MSKLSKVGQRFLNELQKENVKSSFQLLENFMEQLENKEDPSSNEIKLIEEIYGFLEKRKMLEEAMRNYVTKENTNPESDKLYQLLEKRKQKFWSA